MKKYLFGISALALAIAFSAFTTKKTTDVTFRLKSNVIGQQSTYTDDATARGILQNISNWEASGTAGCNNTNNFACAFDVADEFYHLEDEIPVLNSLEDVEESSAPEDDIDGDGVKDEQMILTADDGSFTYQSSPTVLKYQVILSGSSTVVAVTPRGTQPF